ncbi:MAG: transposase [Desulfobacteraceae bacterium]|nr:MAG: transposase [Desulfobacteraceae bacterium]
MAFKKKLYKFRPKDNEQKIKIHYTKEREKTISVNSLSVERHVRQMLSEKISGTLVGLWLLLPEHLRLGTWDLLTAWAGSANPQAFEPRLALQMVHESALCLNGVRRKRTLRQKGFETLNGLPFVATDCAIHDLLNQHSVREAESLQLALGQIRQCRGHYPGKLVLIDPHRIETWTKRQLQLKKSNPSAPASKVLQTFFAIDGDSGQPFGFGIGSSSVTVTQATPSLVERVAAILPNEAVVIADSEHFTVELLKHLSQHKRLSILLPAPQRKAVLRQIPTMDFTPVWAGYAVADGKYQLSDDREPIRQIIQRTGETEETYAYKSFLTTSQMPAADLMTLVFPERWNIEEFFNMESALGWNRASTLNLHIRFGKLSMALIAQAVIYQLRKKLPGDINNWTAESMARKLFNGIDGDLRVQDDTIIVTFYNAPDVNNLKEHYTNLPHRLEAEGVNPKVPWLYNLKVDFRFR